MTPPPGAMMSAIKDMVNSIYFYFLNSSSCNSCDECGTMMDNVSEWEINLDDAISRASSNQKLFARFGVLKMLEGARTKLSNRAQAQTIAKRSYAPYHDGRPFTVGSKFLRCFVLTDTLFFPNWSPDDGLKKVATV
jgi:hypothetical protein